MRMRRDIQLFILLCYKIPFLWNKFLQWLVLMTGHFEKYKQISEPLPHNRIHFVTKHSIVISNLINDTVKKGRGKGPDRYFAKYTEKCTNKFDVLPNNSETNMLMKLSCAFVILYDEFKNEIWTSFT